jgi:hypothetical protein
MKRGLCPVLAAFLVLTSSLLAQEPRDAPRTNHRDVESHQDLPMPSSWKTTDLPAGPIFGNVVCGPHLSLYFRGQGKLQNPLESPVTELTIDGKSRTLDLTKIPELRGHVYIFALGLDSRGAIYAVAKGEENAVSYLAFYDRQGHYLGKSALQEPVRASFQAPVNNNLFLIAGMTMPKDGGANPTSVTALIDSQGSKLRSLAIPEDDQAGAVLPDSGRFFNPSVELGAARLGSDGYVYLFKAASTPTVQVLDAQGNTLRNFQLTPPAAGAQAFDFFLLGNSIVAVYQLGQPLNGEYQLVEFYNAKTGKPTVTYAKRAPGILACSEGKTLVFLRPTPDHHYALGKVALP